jgi:hypothetical protein
MNCKGCFLGVALFFVSLAVFCPMPTGAQDQSVNFSDYTGLELQQRCKAAGEYAKSHTPADTDIFQVMGCIGYFEGVMDTYEFWGESNDSMHTKLHAPACIPNGVTVAEAIRVVLKFLDDHPNMLHEPERLVVGQALAAAYPCKAN